jgi:excinuclease ABC subunit C
MPARIECYDISNTQGTNAVGAMVVFEHGEAKKSAYRKFKIRTVQGANDVASIQEVLRRRFKRAAEATGEALSSSVQEPQNHTSAELQNQPENTEQSTANTEPDLIEPGSLDNEDQAFDERSSIADRPASDDQIEAAKEQSPDETWADLPDLLLIDGGIGQLNGALAVLSELGFDHLPIAGVVKGVNRDRFDLLLPGAADLIVLKRDSPALRLVQTIDEETDRFAKQYHRSLRSKSAIRSTLEDIPGIGPTRRRALLKAFGSLDGIRSATVEEIAAVPGMTRKAAEQLKGLL